MIKIDLRIRYSTDEYDDLCFRHAILEALKGKEVETTIFAPYEEEHGLLLCPKCTGGMYDDDEDEEEEIRRQQRIDELEEWMAKFRSKNTLTPEQKEHRKRLRQQLEERKQKEQEEIKQAIAKAEKVLGELKTLDLGEE